MQDIYGTWFLRDKDVGKLIYLLWSKCSDSYLVLCAKNNKIIIKIVLPAWYNHLNRTNSHIRSPPL